MRRARPAWVGYSSAACPPASRCLASCGSDRSPNSRGSKMRSVNRHAPSTRSNRSWYSPARIGCSPWPVTCSTVKQLRAVAVAPSTCTVTLVIWWRVCGVPSAIDDHAVVVRARFGRRRAAGGRGGSSRARRARTVPPHRRGRRRRAECAYSWISAVISLVIGHRIAPERIGTVAQPRTLPECTRVHPASSIS